MTSQQSGGSLDPVGTEMYYHEVTTSATSVVYNEATLLH